MANVYEGPTDGRQSDKVDEPSFTALEEAVMWTVKELTA